MYCATRATRFGVFVMLCLAVGAGCQSHRLGRVVRFDAPRGRGNQGRAVWEEKSLGSHRYEVINPRKYSAGGLRSLYDIARDSSDPVAAQNARNHLQSTIVLLSDYEVSNHLSRIAGTPIQVRTFLDRPFPTNATPAIGDGVTQPAPGPDDAVVATNVQAYQDVFNQTVITAVLNHRRELAGKIALKRQQSIAGYSVDEAIQDAVDLHEKSSFYHGLRLVHEAAKQTDQRRYAAVEE